MTAIEEFPRELTLEDTGRSRWRWVLTITNPYLTGEVTSSSRECVLAVAEAYAATRAGRLVIELLQEAGIYQEYAGPLLPLIEARREERRAS